MKKVLLSSFLIFLFGCAYSYKLSLPAYVKPKPLERKGDNIATPKMFGAKGDGVHDDILAIEAAVKYAMDNGYKLRFTNGVYRVSRQWVIGYKYIHERDFSYNLIGSAPSCNPNLIDESKIPLLIEADNNATIYGDYNSKELSAIVYYCILPWRKKSEDLTSTITNLKIVGKPGSNQAGLMIIDAYNLKVNNLLFKNLQYGVISNSCYFSEWRNLIFKDCENAFYSIQMNCSKVSNFNCFRSNVAYRFGGAVIVAEVLNTQSCNTSLDLYGSFNLIINGCYFENAREHTTTQYQIIAGKSDISIISPDSKLSSGGTDGVTINEGLFSATRGDPSWAAANLLYISEDCTRIEFNDCTGSGNILNKSKRTIETMLNNYRNIQGVMKNVK